MSYKLVITPVAEADLSSAKEWYDDQREGLGTEFILAVRARLQLIGKQPAIHEAKYKGIRKALVRRFPYIIYYRIESDTVVVYAVHHSRRDPSDWQSRV